MTNECILVSDSNFDLAYNLRNICLKNRIELILSKNVVEMFGYVSPRTKALIVDKPNESKKQLEICLNNTNYVILLVKNDGLYNLQDELIYNTFSEFVKSEIFSIKNEYINPDNYATEVEKCFDKFGVVIDKWQALFVKEVLMHMLVKEEREITKQTLEMVAASVGLKTTKVYDQAAVFLRKNYDNINAHLGGIMKKYETRVVLKSLYDYIRLNIIKNNHSQ